MGSNVVTLRAYRYRKNARSIGAVIRRALCAITLRSSIPLTLLFTGLFLITGGMYVTQVAILEGSSAKGVLAFVLSTIGGLCTGAALALRTFRSG